MQGRKSPVAVAKALHLLAPNFFPLWDNKIAGAYGCYFNNNSAEKYVSFCKTMEDTSGALKKYIRKGQSLDKWCIFMKRGHKEQTSPLPGFSKGVF